MQESLFPAEVYYDIETQRSAEEVGGWNNIHLMRVSVAVSWSDRDGFKRWEENSAAALISYLTQFERVVSFNGDGFDSKVLSFYGNVLPLAMRSFDVLTDLTKKLGHRVKLDSLALATLGVGKTADGLLALRWWKEGKIEQIATYCQQDVQVLVDLVAFGRKNGLVRYADRSGIDRTVSVSW